IRSANDQMGVHMGRIPVCSPDPVYGSEQITLDLAHKPLRVGREVQAIAIDQTDDKTVLVGIISGVSGEGAALDGDALTAEQLGLLTVEAFAMLEVAQVCPRGRGLGDPALHDGSTRMRSRWRDIAPTGPELAQILREPRIPTLSPMHMAEAEINRALVVSI